MEVRGTAVKVFKPFVRERFGAEGLARWQAALPPESSVLFTGEPDPEQWYDMQLALITPTKATCDLFFAGALRGAWELGRFSADHGLTGPKKLFAKLVSPVTLIERGVSVIQRYYRPIAMTVNVIDKAANRYSLDITGMDNPSPMIDHRMAGWVERALEIAGAKEVHLRVTRSATAPRGTSTIEGSWR